LALSRAFCIISTATSAFSTYIVFCTHEKWRDIKKIKLMSNELLTFEKESSCEKMKGYGVYFKLTLAAHGHKQSGQPTGTQHGLQQLPPPLTL
jgi:hypothetical protein